MAVITHATTRVRARNPIAWQELTHQVRSAPHLMKRLRLVGPLLLGALIGFLVLSLSQYVDNRTREMTIIAVWFVHAIFITRTIIAGANAVSREHVGQTWDALILTGISARQILIGKWAAALRRSAPWMLAFGTFRLATLPLFMFAFVTRIAWRYQYFLTNNSSSNYGSTYDYAPPSFTLFMEIVIIGVLLTVMLTLLEWLACTALGLMASAVTRRGIAAMIMALSLRFLPIVLFAGLTRYELGASRAMRSWQLLRQAKFAIADSGTSPLTQLMLPYWSQWRNWNRNIYGDAAAGLLLATLVLTLILGASLFISWYAIRTSGALPHPKPEKRLNGRAFRARSAEASAD